jgi:hypothetical protein
MSQQDAGEELESSEGPDAEGDHFGKPTEGDQGSSRGRPPEAKQPPRTNENSSLMNKLRDAMADLLSRLKIQPPSTESEQASDSTQGGFQSGRQRQTLSQKGSPGPDRQQSDRGSEMGQQGNQEGENSQGSQNARGDSRQGNSGQRSSDERSGIGKEDGSKELREAEQLAAMGKISEIIGKRSANVTGEVMVEVASGNEQQLKTQYSQSSARHSDVGGEIHRDEVPLIFQHYVQRYFEEVRKIPATRSAGTRADDR